MITIIDFIASNIERIKFLTTLLAASMLIWAAAEMDKHHAHTWVEKHIPDFWFLFASLSALILIIIAGFIAKNIQADEDYYDK